MEASGHFPDLPEDLITDILLRLPVKSLLRFRSVCKKWLNLIESPSFIDKHLHHESNSTSLLFYWYGNVLSHDPYKAYIHAFFLFPDETLERREELEHLKMPCNVLGIRGPCRGVFCVHSRNYNLALWNPATRRMRPLPAPPKRFPEIEKIESRQETGSGVEIGFGVDPLTDEFKVVLFQAGYSGIKCPDFAVYTSRNGSWRFVEKEPFLNGGADGDVFVQHTPCSTTFLNGFYYWRRFDMANLSSVILAFDMHKEVFEEIEMPDANVGANASVDLALYNDSLALVSYNGDPDLEDKSIEIWVMRGKGCWEKLYSVVLPLNISSIRGFWNNDKIFVLTHDNELILCDLDSDNAKNLRIEKRGAISYEVLLFYYKESLISVKGGDGLHDYDIHSDAIRFLFDWEF